MFRVSGEGVELNNNAHAVLCLVVGVVQRGGQADLHADITCWDSSRLEMEIAAQQLRQQQQRQQQRRCCEIKRLLEAMKSLGGGSYRRVGSGHGALLCRHASDIVDTAACHALPATGYAWLISYRMEHIFVLFPLVLGASVRVLRASS